MKLITAAGVKYFAVDNDQILNKIKRSSIILNKSILQNRFIYI